MHHRTSHMVPVCVSVCVFVVCMLMGKFGCQTIAERVIITLNS